LSTTLAAPSYIIRELHRQLTVTTSSSKKRRISPRHAYPAESPSASSPDRALPSCEADDEPALSFTESRSFPDIDSHPASSLPPRLQTTQYISHISAEYAESTASTPTGVAELYIDSDRGGDLSGPETGTVLSVSDRYPARSQSPLNIPRHVIMTGDADLPQRSSSPLKRRASSMEPGHDTVMNGTEKPSFSASNLNPDGRTNAEEEVAVSPAQRTHYPRAMSVDLPEPTTAASRDRTTEPPPLAEQIKTIQTLLQTFSECLPKVGDVAYAVSKSWVNRALAFGGDPKYARKEFLGQPLGPVDNSDIVQSILSLEDGLQFVQLKPGVGMEDLELFPEDAWILLIEWYGLKEGQAPIKRYAVNTAPDAASPDNIVFELNPPVFTVHRLWSSTNDIPLETQLQDTLPAVLVRSVTTPYNEFFKDLKRKTRIPMQRKMRVFSIMPQPRPAASDPVPSSALTPPDSPDPEQNLAPELWNRLLVDVSTYLGVEASRRCKIEAVDHTGNQNYNGKSPLSLFALTQDQILVLDEEVEKGDFVSTYFKKRGNSKAIASRASGTSLLPQSRDAHSGRSSPAASIRSGPVTRGRAQHKRPGRSTGAVGLQNLGNTCYMNSALQCVRSVEELTKYFLTAEYEEELNTDNPLGYHGQVAITYGRLLKEIYRESKSSVTPREFKSTIGRCRSTFSGWGQQDSQEFLGFLLDGLQEDLSRIKKKPYIEKPDSTDDMIGNEAAIREMAEKVWDITRKRDDSVIADLFTGMYKSTLKCPVCHKVSITFDPFNNLTLPLPIEELWSRTVKFYPLNDRPVQLDIELPKHSSMERLRTAVSEKTVVPIDRLLGGEEFKDRFFKIYEDHEDVCDVIQPNDIATFHEVEAVPTNWPRKPPGRRSMLDIDEEPFADPRAERMAVPVFHRRKTPTAMRFNREDVTCPPHFIVLTRDEAYSEDAIRRKILEKTATFSTSLMFADDSTTDTDTAMVTQSDADSSGDSKIMVHSVEGEDDMVEVSMPKACGRPASEKLPRQYNAQRPKWVSRKHHLPAQLQNLFELSFLQDRSGDPLPSGWHCFDDKREFPRLSTRAPADSPSEQDANSPGAWTNGADSDNESNSDQQSPATASAATVSAQTRMNDESSDDGDVPIKPHFRNQRPAQRIAGGRKKARHHRMQGGKKGGVKHRNKEWKAKMEQAQPVDVPPQPSPLDDVPGPLVRLHEGIVVDWSQEAWDAVFGGGDDQGSATFFQLEQVRDPVLEQRRKKRQARSNKGITLDECLDEFEKAEILSEQDMWYCPRCKEHRRASKKFDLWKTPDILVVHLKRFSSSGYRRDKLDVMVDFPIQDLDLRNRVLYQEDGKEEIYDLFAVDEHFGGLGGGHYTAWAKNFIDGRWYHFNDSSVSPGQAESSVTKAAYLLFYRRRSDGPLGGPRFRQICDKFDNPTEDDDDEAEQEMADAGEGRRLGDGSSPLGSSRPGLAAGAIHPEAGRGSARSATVTRGDDEDELLSFEGSSSTNVGSDVMQTSIEGDRHTGGGFQPTQGWSFQSLDASHPPSLGLEDYASDDAQADSDGPDLPSQGSEVPFLQDRYAPSPSCGSDMGDQPPPPPDVNAQIGLADIQATAWDRNADDRVIAVPPADDDAASTEAAEIHLTDDDQQPSMPHAEKH
ncbi:UCH-domain-containing protein, partial [Sodiomyces alkalinus F11]